MAFIAERAIITAVLTAVLAGLLAGIVLIWADAQAGADCTRQGRGWLFADRGEVALRCGYGRLRVSGGE